MRSIAQSLNGTDPKVVLKDTANLRDEINTRLEQLMPERGRPPARLHEAMRHCLLSGGKRVRPVLCVLVAESAGGAGRALAMDAGCAIEMVHTASLLLDDLPSMDDAAVRRGRPATHVKFGEATTILASIGLLNRAFAVVAESPAADPDVKVRVADLLSQAIGSDGMIAGQEIDLHQRAEFNGGDAVENLNWLKTGVLFVASAHIGSVCGQLDDSAADHVKNFARHLGLAFQTADDLIDQTSDVETAGKDVHQDDGKPTLISLSGIRAARHSCEEHLVLANEALDRSGIECARIRDLMAALFHARQSLPG